VLSLHHPVEGRPKSYLRRNLLSEEMKKKYVLYLAKARPHLTASPLAKKIYIFEWSEEVQYKTREDTRCQQQ